MIFNELGLAEPIVRAVAAEGYKNPTPIQKKAIPPVLAGKDVLGCAQTGTGKTGAFAGLPILHRLAAAAAGRTAGNSAGKAAGKAAGKIAGETGPDNRRDRGGARGRKPRALVLCPTRELATQIFESFKAYGRNLSIQPAVIFGGVSQFHQVRRLRAGTDVLVATPGRLLDLMNQRCVDLRAIEVLVLDEADRMLDMGFIHDIRRIVEQLPPRRQTLFFSATMPAEIGRLADSILRDPVQVNAAPTATTADAISQSVYMIPKRNKAVLLERLLRRDAMDRTLIFTRTKHGADKLVSVLRRSGVDAGAIHGNKSQGARTRALDGFKSGRTPVLVATDIASRGIDVEEITHVVNFDMPHDPETYIHRIGRTARRGASGIALSFCDHAELDGLRAIERLIDMKLNVAEGMPDLVSAAPATNRESASRPPSRDPASRPPNRRNRGSGPGMRGKRRRGASRDRCRSNG